MTEQERFEAWFSTCPDFKVLADRFGNPFSREADGSYWLSVVRTAFDSWQAATAQAVPEGHVAVPVEPTYLMIKRAAESVCKEWEGTPTILLDFLDFSGENMAHLVIAEALRQAVKAALKAESLERNGE